MKASSSASSSSPAGMSNPIQVFQNALAGQPASDTTVAGSAQDPANAYPSVIQGLLGGGLYDQPYTDALSQLSLNTAPPQPQLYTVGKGDTLSGIAGGDYAQMANIAAANDLKLTANGSPLLRTGQRLAIPDTSGLDPVAYRRLDTSGRNLVAANTQAMAQRQAAQTAAFPNNPSLAAQNVAQLFSPGYQWLSPPPKLSTPNPGNYYIDGHGNGYFLTNDASGSKMVFDDRAQRYWQQKWDEAGKALGYGPDGQPGIGVFGSIGYSYPKYVFHASDDVANLLGGMGSAVDGVGAGLSGVGPYRPPSSGSENIARAGELVPRLGAGNGTALAPMAAGSAAGGVRPFVPKWEAIGLEPQKELVQTGEYTCGPACGGNLAQRLGYNGVTEGSIIDAIGNGNTSAEQISTALASQTGLEFRAGAWGRAGLASDAQITSLVKQATNGGRSPLLVLFHEPGVQQVTDPGHWVSVQGVDAAGNIRVMDPAGIQYSQTPRGFARAWKSGVFVFPVAKY